MVRDISCTARASAVRWANRAMLARISSAVFVQTNGFGFVVMRIDERLNRRFELRHAAKGAAADLLHRQLGEPAFDETQPRGVRRREVHVEARAFGEPVPDQRRFVGAVVVHDDVHVESTRHLRLDQIEKFAKLRRAVPLMKLRDHFAGLRIERGKQGRRPVPLVVVRPAFDLARLHRQQRLRAIERLNLRLLIDAEDRRMRGRIQIQPDDVPDLLDQAADRSTA